MSYSVKVLSEDARSVIKMSYSVKILSEDVRKKGLM